MQAVCDMQSKNINGRFTPLHQILAKYFYKPDEQALRIVMGAIQAHYLKIGDPAWLFVVAPPGTGKTTTSIMGCVGLPEVQTLSDFSENTFLSGFFGHKQPGLLEKLGHIETNGNTHVTDGNGIFIAKDFTTVLSMRREKRAAILSQLREIHDGYFRRDFGTGDSKIWTGRVTIVAAVTPVLDAHYGVFTTLGERFLQVRWHRPDSEVAGVWAIEQQGMEKEINETLGTAVQHLFKSAVQTPPEISQAEMVRLASLAEVVSLARTHVFRSGYGNRDIEYVPEPEANTRISKGLAALSRGIAALAGHNSVQEQDLQDAMRVGLDSLTDLRRRVFEASLCGTDPQRVKAPTTTLVRAIEDLHELGVLDSERKPTARVSEL